MKILDADNLAVLLYALGFVALTVGDFAKTDNKFAKYILYVLFGAILILLAIQIFMFLRFLYQW